MSPPTSELVQKKNKKGLDITLTVKVANIEFFIFNAIRKHCKNKHVKI